MPNWLHRTTLSQLNSVPSADLPEAEVNYVEEPDYSPIAGCAKIYWILTGHILSLMDQSARDAVDVAVLDAANDATSDTMDRGFEKAFAQVVMDEINILRGQHSLADRTLAQLKSAVRSKL